LLLGLDSNQHPSVNRSGVRHDSVSDDLVALSRRGAFPDTRSKLVSRLDVRNPVTTKAFDLGAGVYKNGCIPILPPHTIADEPDREDSSPPRCPVHRPNEIDRGPAVPPAAFVWAIGATLEDRVMQWVIGKPGKVAGSQVVDAGFTLKNANRNRSVDTSQAEDLNLWALMSATPRASLVAAGVHAFAELLAERDPKLCRPGA
jgi:hypothetical protein